ncbi:MAG: hypothetical protein PHQ42_04555 [Patescibacteria group bacterium]|nr:hypothetical protein [Patescibacteria group bacterium]
MEYLRKTYIQKRRKTMTTGLITPTEGQEKQLSRIVEDAVKRAREQVVLDKDAMQRLLANGGKFQSDIIVLLAKHSIADNRFDLLTSFEITVPEGYDHKTQLATFASYAKKEKFYFYNEAITDDNFANATGILVPRKTYMVKIFGIKKRVSSEDCLVFLATQMAILVGAQGLSLVRQLKKDEFPVGKWTASFDKKDALWEDADGNRRVPCMDRHSDGDWGFDLGGFEHDWNGDYCLLCLCDLSA